MALATPTVVRVGGPSDTADSKIAIVGSDRNLKGAGFQVTLGTRTVLRGKLRAARGSPAPWAHAYRADLSALQDPGSYRVRAGGTVSRPWLVQAGGSEPWSRCSCASSRVIATATSRRPCTAPRT